MRPPASRTFPAIARFPDHPLVTQAVRDCLQEAMDFDVAGDASWNAFIAARFSAWRATRPSRRRSATRLLNARPYAFLDDAPLEERRAHAVYTRRAGEPGSAGALGALDAAAIARVVRRGAARAARSRRTARCAADRGISDRSRKSRRSAPAAACDRSWTRGGATLATRCHVASSRRGRAAARAARRSPGTQRSIRRFRRAAQRAPNASGHATTRWSNCCAAASRWSAPVTASRTRVRRSRSTAPRSMQALEDARIARRGAAWHVPIAALASSSGASAACSRASTATRSIALRAEIEPVSPADYMRFLFDWQHVRVASPVCRAPTGLLQVAEERSTASRCPPAAWESSVLPSRIGRLRCGSGSTCCA